jgi:ParB/Sulfiredoxin domain/Protein of unknown function (DUF3102)
MTTIAVVDQGVNQLAAEINAEHAAATQAARDGLAHARRAGDLLQQVKDELPYGQFMDWVEQHCTFAYSTAALYLKVASGWERLESSNALELSLRAAARLLYERADEPTVEAAGPAAALTVSMRSLDALRHHPRNYKQHPEDQLEHLVRSIEEHGWLRPVVVARDDTILAGHGLVEAAKLLGHAQVPVRQLDLAADDPRALKLLIADNEIGGLALLDDRKLTDELKALGTTDEALLGTGSDRLSLAARAFDTRRKDEIANREEAAAWAGVAGFDPGDPLYQLKISFRNEADRDAFVAQHEIVVTRRTQNKEGGAQLLSAWWPPQSAGQHDRMSVKWMDPEGEQPASRCPE